MTAERGEKGDSGTVQRPFGVAIVDPMLVMTERREGSSEDDLIKCPSSVSASLVVSRVAITDEALLAKL